MADLKTTKSEIMADKNKLWDVAAVYLSDCEKIKEWLKAEAIRALGSASSVNDKIRALDNYPTLSHDLEQIYKLEEFTVNPKLQQDAKDGKLEQEAPSSSAKWFWLFCLIMAGGLELVFFSYMVIYKGAGPALIGLAVIIILGGLFAGHSIYQLMMHGKKSEYELSKKKVEKKYFVLLGIGIFLILLVTAIRFMGAGFYGGIVAFLFGLAVVTTDAFFFYYRGLRKYYLELMFKVQEYYAATQLERDLGERNNHIDDKWPKTAYESYINSTMKTVKEVTTPPPTAR